MKKKFTFIDLFAGIGGFRLAMEKHGLQCVFSSEIDTKCQKIYEQNFGEIPFGDITKIHSKEIPDFDILAAGFPCQPFSYAGKLDGFEDKTRGTLFFDIVKIIKEKSPKMFLLENVKGLKSHLEGQTMDIILNTLKKLDYTIYWDILDTYDFGIPQKRPRWYCVGFKEKKLFKFPKGISQKSSLKSILETKNNDPKLKLTKHENDQIDFHFKNCSMSSTNQIRVQHDNSKYASGTKKGKHGVFSYLKPDKTLRFHIGDFAKTQIQEAYYCHPDSFSPAIIASRAPKLWSPRRHLSILECKRLQNFPDNFELPDAISVAKKQLGNAVNVKVVESIIHEMIISYNQPSIKEIPSLTVQ